MEPDPVNSIHNQVSFLNFLFQPVIHKTEKQ